MLITVEYLTIAIQKALDVERKEAYQIASLVMDFFGFEDRILDNVLTTEERQMFYRLQEKGLLSAAREETILPSGSPWRIHYWLLEKATIFQYSLRKVSEIKKPRLEKEPRSIYEHIYSNVPQELWAMRKTLDV